MASADPALPDGGERIPVGVCGVTASQGPLGDIPGFCLCHQCGMALGKSV